VLLAVSSADVLYNYAAILTFAGRQEEAIAQAERVIDQDPTI